MAERKLVYLVVGTNKGMTTPTWFYTFGSYSKKNFMAEAYVKFKGASPNTWYWSPFGVPVIIPDPKGLNRIERARIKRTCADLAAIEIGHPYTLRSKL